MSPVARAATSVPSSGTRVEPRRSATACCISNNHPRLPRSEAPDLYSLFRTVLAHDGGATGASCSCGTHIEQRSGASLRGSQVDVAEMQYAVCSLLEVLSGNNSSCSCDLLAMAVEPQPSFYWASNPILDVRFVHRVSLARDLEHIVPPVVSQAEGRECLRTG